MKIFRKVIYFWVLMCFTTVLAEASTCSADVQKAMATVQQDCGATGRNQACYGYVALSATPRAGVQNFTFSHEGDVVNVADLSSLQLTPFDPVKNTWGIALMKLQANLPDALPGENVTFLMFGDVKITNAVPTQPAAGQAATPAANAFAPMQAFYFQTGVSGTKCTAADNGLLIQTPKGAGMINLRANNVDIKLGSTAYLEAQPGKTMNFYVVEGKSELSSNGKAVVVPAGAEDSVPLDDSLSADGDPGDPEAYDPDEVSDLPIQDLPDEITVSDPADDQTIQDAQLEATDASISESSTDEATEALSTDEATDESTEALSTDEATDQSIEGVLGGAATEDTSLQSSDQSPAQQPTDTGDTQSQPSDASGGS